MKGRGGDQGYLIAFFSHHLLPSATGSDSLYTPWLADYSGLSLGLLPASELRQIRSNPSGVSAK